MITLPKISKKLQSVLAEINIFSIITPDMSYIDVDDNDNYITFLPLDRIKKIENDKLDPWKNGRNKMKIGRFLKSYMILNDSEVENVVNQYKSYYKFINGNADDIFEIVSGDEIVYCYQSQNYIGIGGTLDTSCMNNSHPTRLELYTKNPDKCKLLVIKGGNKIIARALLWNTDKGWYIDRPYCRYDKDIRLYSKYAEHKKYKHFYDTNKGIMSVNNITVPHGQLPSLDTFHNVNDRNISNL